MNAVKYTLPNGLRVILTPRPESIATNILVLAEAGSKYENKEISGLSHFLEHMCFKGTKKRPKTIDISAELDSLGAQYNAFTAQEYTGYFATVQPNFFARALDLVADMYLNPTFSEAEIEKEKGVIIEEINMYEDLPVQRIQDLFLELLYGDQPAGWSIAGTKETVRQLQRSDFFAYREKHYLASATLVLVAGNLKEAEVLPAIADAFASLPVGVKQGKVRVFESQATPRTVLKSKPSDQTHLVLGFRSYPLTHPSYFALEVLAAVLGGGMSSRLFQRIRNELGAAYYVRAAQDAFTDHGFLQAAVGADTDRVQQIIRIILAECRKLQEEKVPAAELRRVKDSLIGQLYLGLETAQSLALFCGVQEILKGTVLSPQEIADRLEAVSAEKIQSLAATLFVGRHLNLALIGPFPEEQPFVEVLHL